MSVDARLAELGITLPAPAAPAANYVPTLITGNLLFISGQLPFNIDGHGFVAEGKVGVDVTIEKGAEAAKHCALYILAQAKSALGTLDRVKRVVRIGGFVNCADGFAQQPAVINGASNVIVEILGEKGRHARTAVGTNALPFNVPVEIEALIEFE